jgi:hypothetical protein
MVRTLMKTRTSLFLAGLGASLLISIASFSATEPRIAQQSVQAPHAMRISVSMTSPVTQSTDLQIICILKHEAAGDKYIASMQDLNDKLGGMLSSLRERGAFAGDLGETLILSPPQGTITPRRVLLIGVGEEKSLTLDSLRVVGTIALRESLTLGARHVSFAPSLRDQGSRLIDVGEGDGIVAQQVVLAYDTAKKLEAQGLVPKADIVDFTIQAGPAFFDSAVTKVQAAVSTAAAQLKDRTDAPYMTIVGK